MEGYIKNSTLYRLLAFFPILVWIVSSIIAGQYIVHGGVLVMLFASLTFLAHSAPLNMVIGYAIGVFVSGSCKLYMLIFGRQQSRFLSIIAVFSWFAFLFGYLEYFGGLGAISLPWFVIPLSALIVDLYCSFYPE